MDAMSSLTTRARSARVARLSSFPLAWPALAALLVAVGLFLFHETRGTTFWFDEWTWVLHRRGNDLGTFLAPHNGHLSLVPILVYRVLFAAAGLEHYGAYRAVVIIAHLTCVTLVFVYARRRVGDLLGLLAASLLLFLGPAYQNVLWPFQVGWLISLAAGVAALLMLDRADRKGDVAACGLLVVSVASSGLGLPIAAGMLVEVLRRPRGWRTAWIVGVPLALYVPWWLHYQDSSWIRVAHAFGVEHPLLTGILDSPGFAANAAASALSALLGLSGHSGADLRGAGTFISWGAPLAIAAVAILVWVARGARGLSPRVIALLTMMGTFWVLTGVTRVVFSDPFTSRYLYVGGLLIVLASVELARGVRVGRGASVALIALVAFAVLSNVGDFRDGGRYLRSQASDTRALATAFEIARPVVSPSFVAEGFAPIVAGEYFAATRELGSPADSPTALAREPESARLKADAELAAMHGLALRPSSRPRTGSPPRVDAVAGVAARPRNGCLAIVPAGVTSGPNGGRLALTLPASGLAVVAVDAPVTVSVRRFADGFHPLASLAPGASATLKIRPDLAAAPWHMRVVSTGRATVCGLV